MAIAALLLAGLAAPAWAQATGEGLDLRETLAGVLAYTRWPVPPDPLRLCFAGTSPHAERLQQQGFSWSGSPPVLLRKLEPGVPVATQCDALYLGALGAAQWQQLTDELDGQPVLTLCERSTPCLASGMVRMDIDAAGRQVRFEINLDAVARGTVRIHPQVLRLGHRGIPQERKP
ncbi:YfiR family protein [Pseudorhodoferax sp.]|uniref:YfiR family protein n=1 Tax=Pseudorhodoferax sp. TaxID=1993553 RepID=UPI002DD64DC8|nr:YfiR family protein [Pseudorhodoferax sp.]